MTLFKTVCVGLAVMTLAACATENNYSLAVRSWQGANENQLFHIWGYPDSIQRLPNGQRLLVYRSNDKGRNPMFTTPGNTVVSTSGGASTISSSPTVVSGGGTYHYYCTTWFAVNKAGRVVNTSFRGNNCIASSAFVQRQSNQHK